MNVLRTTFFIFFIFISFLSKSQTTSSFKNIISFSPETFFVGKGIGINHKFYYGGTMEALINVKKTAFGIGGNLITSKNDYARKFTVGYFTVKQFFANEKFMPNLYGALGYGSTKHYGTNLPKTAKGLYFHIGGGVNYRVSKSVAPFINVKYVNYILDKYKVNNQDKTNRVEGVGVSAGISILIN